VEYLEAAYAYASASLTMSYEFVILYSVGVHILANTYLYYTNQSIGFSILNFLNKILE
jgi:hypothetical protein